LKSLGKHKQLSEIELLAKTKSIDEKTKEDKGMINISEFLKVVKQISSNELTKTEIEVQMEKVLGIYDQNDDTKIEIAELRNIFVENDEKITDQEIDELIQEADVGGDGKINLKELVNMMLDEY